MEQGSQTENYALSILKEALRNEHLAKGAAEEYVQASGMSGKNRHTIAAFQESLRLAKERIPHLETAIYRIETPIADLYLKSEGFDPEELLKEGIAYINNLKARINPRPEEE